VASFRRRSAWDIIWGQPNSLPGKIAVSTPLSPQPETLIVGEFTMDMMTGELERDGLRIRLQDKPFRLLRMLIAQAGELVTREQLSECLWPEGYVDFETGLNTAVRKLRAALQDDTDAPRYIETLPRRGYRLVAAVRTPGITHSTPAVTASPDAHDSSDLATVRQRGWRAVIVALLSVGLVCLLAVRLWPLRSESSPVSAQSIVVLPFTDMSEKKDQEYFSDGLSEELIELLGRTPNLRVVARTSSFYFKGKKAKLETIAKELHVANVLEGSVRRSGDRLRVTAQLIRAKTNEHIWSETFERDVHDIFKVQDEIGAAVVVALRVHLLPAQQSAARNDLHTSNMEAYNLYLQGRESYNRGDVAGFRDARTALRAATTLDPGYAPAYADMALAEFWLADDTWDVQGYEAALTAAEQAVRLAPELAEGYSARGFLRAVYRFDFAGAKSDLDKAMALSPWDATVLHRSAILLGIFGELPEAIAREQKALALDPLSEEICRRLAFFLVADGRLAQARPLYEKALAIAPNSDRARYNLGVLELLENHPQQALADFGHTESEELQLGGQAKAEYSLQHPDEAQRALNQLIARLGVKSSGMIARVYAWRGEKQQAFEWAERAYLLRDTGITWLKVDPDFRSLRGDPRYRALLQRMNLPVEALAAHGPADLRLARRMSAGQVPRLPVKLLRLAYQAGDPDLLLVTPDRVAVCTVECVERNITEGNGSCRLSSR
jgi:TolB-like protein/DNA-binding winged helix-turn-helix (wHTH) protein/Tfp pilus assembly protein PilF